jgi:hypothetical protein
MCGCTRVRSWGRACVRVWCAALFLGAWGARCVRGVRLIRGQAPQAPYFGAISGAGGNPWTEGNGWCAGRAPPPPPPHSPPTLLFKPHTPIVRTC